MSIRVSKNQQWGFLEVAFRVRLPDGTRYRERVKSPVQTKTGAARWAEERARHLMIHGPALPEEEAPTFEQVIPRFLEEHVRANRLKPSTAATTTTGSSFTWFR